MKKLKKIRLLFLFIIMSSTCFSQKSPYPIIFVHGITGNDNTFIKTMEKYQSLFEYGDINVFDVSLNSDNNQSYAKYNLDVNFISQTCIDLTTEKHFKFGRRNIDHNKSRFEWYYSSIFAINFGESRFQYFDNDNNWHIQLSPDPLNFNFFKGSNQSAIYKQGYALSIMIKEVLDFTKAEKVILVGHSMGGLAIREYLQRKENTHRKWWVNKSDESNGHKVAKVVTIGTPHYGFDRPLPWTGFLADPNSEAIRDMYGKNCNWCKDQSGVYLNSGFESSILYYFNHDVNCNGNNSDEIIGLNELNTLKNNFVMNLPENISYSWIQSDEDDVVDDESQWLYLIDEEDKLKPIPSNVSDTIQAHSGHVLPSWNNEGGDYKSIIRALDEPKTPFLSYHLNLDNEYYNFSTIQTGYNSEKDYDWYKVILKPGNLVISLDGIIAKEKTRKGILEFFTQGLSELNNNSQPHDSVDFSSNTAGVVILTPMIELTEREYYIRITHKDIEENEWETPFKINITQNVIEVDFKAILPHGIINEWIEFEDISIQHSVPTIKRIWDFGDGSKPDTIMGNDAKYHHHIYKTPGIFSVKLIVENAFGFFQKVRENYIYINPDSCPKLTIVSYSWDSTPFNTSWIDMILDCPYSIGNFIDIDCTIPINNMTPGLHRLNIRVLDDSLKWSIPQTRMVLIENTENNIPNITKMECFVDNDPGQGNGSNISIYSNKDIDRIVNFNLQNLSAGLHRFYFRAKDANGDWGIPHVKPVLVQNTEAVTPNITELEYFIDTDLGVGNGTQFLTSDSTQLSLEPVINLSSIPVGLHRFYIRGKDENNDWGIPQVKNVLVQNTDSSKISEIEYFIENDPGIGNGKKLNVSSNFDISIDDSISLMEFSSPDTLTLFARAKNENGVWSFPNAIGFIIKDSSFKIILNSGWNIISSYLQSFEPDSMNNVLDDVAGNMLIAKDISGDVYIPQYDINTIGKWDVTQGYQLYMTQTDTLSVTGVEVIPSETPIQLTVGWNMISYLRNSEISAELAFASITDNENLLIAKTLEGLVYIPSFQINTIGNMKPGVGYRVYVTTSDTLVYPDN